MTNSTFSDDVALLRRHAEVVTLAGPGDGRVAVVPAFQGRVMTSTLGGPAGASFGWLNAAFIEAEQDDPRFNNHGGEDRFWLGPEAGQFALWFAAGEPFDLAHWKTPAGFNSGAFEVVGQDERSIEMTRQFAVTNYAGTTFQCAVRRTIRALGADDLAERLGAAVPDDVAVVAFESENVLTNAGTAAWTRQSGLLSVWILGQFKPLARGKVIVPVVAGSEAELGPRATTDYFGPLSAERCAVGDDCVLFSCDGRYRSKIGISPARARDVVGSYDPDGGVLTVVQFSLPADARALPYVNSLWEIQDEPFSGDVVNSYNDGEPEPGAGQMGPFYEIETSSPGAGLSAGQAVTHVHRTVHFAGAFGALEEIARRVLGVELSRIG